MNVPLISTTDKIFSGVSVESASNFDDITLNTCPNSNLLNLIELIDQHDTLPKSQIAKDKSLNNIHATARVPVTDFNYPLIDLTTPPVFDSPVFDSTASIPKINVALSVPVSGQVNTVPDAVLDHGPITPAVISSLYTTVPNTIPATNFGPDLASNNCSTKTPQALSHHNYQSTTETNTIHTNILQIAPFLVTDLDLDTPAPCLEANIPKAVTDFSHSPHAPTPVQSFLKCFQRSLHLW